MAFTFMRVSGQSMGASLVEEDKLDVARRLQSIRGDKLLLPRDIRASRALKKRVKYEIFHKDIPDGLMDLDIGPESTRQFSKVISEARTIVWNGTMSVFEVKPFGAGTFSVADALMQATQNRATIVGGDSVAAIEMFGLSDRVRHVSTDGGASLEFMEGKSFQPIEILDDL